MATDQIPLDTVPPRPDRCETCKFWGGPEICPPGQLRDCRIRAPLDRRIAGEPNTGPAWWEREFPHTYYDDWCGEWKPKAAVAAPLVLDSPSSRKNYQAWARLFSRLLGSSYLAEPIERMMKRKIKVRTTFRAIGVQNGKLSWIIQDHISQQLTGRHGGRRDNLFRTDPASIPDVGPKLLALIDQFDPFTFVWPAVKFAPKELRNFRACGLFSISDDPGA